jgi:hypothetical protein
MTPDDDRPWEQPWCSRRDCEPHRGGLLQFLGTASVWSAVFSQIVLAFLVVPAPAYRPTDLLDGLLYFSLRFVPSLLGLFAGVAAGWMAWWDWDLMRAGRMDAVGREPTEVALGYAALGVAASLVSLPLLACYSFVWLE